MSERIGQDVVAGALALGLEPRPLRSQPRVMRMVLEGEISRDDLGDLAAMLFRLCSGGQVNVVLDLAGVTHFDYRGVRPLVRRADAFRELGGDLRLAGLSPYLAAIFRSAGAHDAFDAYATVEDAVASFHRGLPAPGR